MVMRIKADMLERMPTPYGTMVTFFTDDGAEVDKLFALDKTKPIVAEFKVERSKRSTQANNYHYKLCEEIAKVIGSTREEVHVTLMERYGTAARDADGNMIFVLLKSTSTSSMGAYLMPTHRYENKKGVEYQWYLVIKPSHEYDTTEMARLIDGTVSEAKDLGVETMTPDEIERMKATWGGGRSG